MKRSCLVLIVPLLVGACAPLTIWHSPGMRVADVERAADSCRVSALRDAPVATRLVQAPPVFLPSRRVCDAAGSCVTEGGFFVPGQISTIDPNEDLRMRLVDRCMADRGFDRVSVPICPAAIREAAPQGRTDVLPPITQTSCAIRRGDGTFRIVTRG